MTTHLSEMEEQCKSKMAEMEADHGKKMQAQMDTRLKELHALQSRLTDDVSLQVFMEHLKRLAVAS